MSDRVAVGIDPSLTGCAVAVRGAGPEADLHEHGSKPLGKSCLARARRYVPLAAAVAAHVPEGAVVFIEGYAFNKKHASEATAEFGWELRQQLLTRASVVVEVSGSTLKKFAAGKGNAPKAAVASHLTRRYGQAFATDNEADAFGLLVLGECALGLREPETKQQREAAEAIAQKLQDIEAEIAALPSPKSGSQGSLT